MGGDPPKLEEPPHSCFSGLGLWKNSWDVSILKSRFVLRTTEHWGQRSRSWAPARWAALPRMPLSGPGVAPCPREAPARAPLPARPPPRRVPGAAPWASERSPRTHGFFLRLTLSSRERAHTSTADAGCSPRLHLQSTWREVSTRLVSLPGGRLAVFGDASGCPSPGESGCWHLVGGVPGGC